MFGASTIEIPLPDWLIGESRNASTVDTPERRMEYVIGLSRRNVELGTGGPFGAAVFDMDDHAVVSIGVNLVSSTGLSIAHAEMVAIAAAQKRIGTFDLSRDGARHELVTSTEPCAMCLGAICWAGLAAVACGARGEDAERIGFDEGPKPDDWRSELTRRGVAVTVDIERSQAAAVLLLYAERGGQIY